MARSHANLIDALPGFALAPQQLHTFADAKAYRQQLLDAIGQAKQRILMVALYLQDDTAGREVFDALIAAKQANPELEISVLVDFHRAQRGLIGDDEQLGNDSMYRARLAEAGVSFPVYGVPVKTKEVMGVLHLKGFVVDDFVLYSGASLNNVYLHHGERYRLDRYYRIEQPELADSMADFIRQVLVADPSIQNLVDKVEVKKRELNRFIARYKRRLSKSEYRNGELTHGARITPLVGLGRRANKLNRATLQLIKDARKQVFLCTPYFNPPRAIEKALGSQLRAGRQISIVVGDKTANDFYIPPEQEFNLIGTVPYLYEMALRRFAKRYQWAIDQGLLNIYLWKDGNNSYHLKGLSIDERYHLITGSNLNPRAWGLDLENGLLLQDPNRDWQASFEQEQQGFVAQSQKIQHYRDVQKSETYPAEVRKILNRVQRFNAGFLLRQLL
ncbi:CDP-diacylglycerol--serine O-phosphatidyltransferase [Paraferrimonas sedimenticola]|uniref:CDP-diacylglycerol--serine O-phosphatidyltransferase n=1 Tax=Paraferrimonas sedimenticola TaxID=375674 RepID=A0AA37RWZ6_9GAMM|nr:CDP-diacylglycerol--serine O-phosphatidyltransferase [Paraferrimonas sedimenticola]GLP96608.1 CDP-diacylglycerol--serine O-phosphatidyltransferase [Paraferrimonas sedimenticola]